MTAGPAWLLEEDAASASRRALNEALLVAQAGDRPRARQMCAAIVFDAQPMLTERADLLRDTIAVLLTARSFQLLSRLVASVSGYTTDVRICRDLSGAIAPPEGTWDGQRMTLTLDPRWLDRIPGDDAFLRRWSELLIAGMDGDMDVTGEWSGTPLFALA